MQIRTSAKCRSSTTGSLWFHPSTNGAMTTDVLRPPALPGVQFTCSKTLACVSAGVAVIGNGPAGMMTSFMLQGHLPFYKFSNGPAPAGIPPWLHRRLSAVTGSLLDANLEELSNGLEGRSSNPVAVLFDLLERPRADFGAALTSLIEWRYDATRYVPHVVLGKGAAGGIVSSAVPSSQSLSAASWMELPGFSIDEWKRTQANSTDDLRDSKRDRARLSSVAQYYHDYCQQMGIAENMLNCASIERTERLPDGGWMLHGTIDHCLTGKVPLRLRASSVILATGVFDVPRSLPSHVIAPGAEQAISSSASSLSLIPTGSSMVVVGGGLSAADAVLALLERGVSVFHVFRGPTGVVGRLPLAEYPEYAQILSAMTGATVHEGYTPLSDWNIVSIAPTSDLAYVTVQRAGQEMCLPASKVFVAVGSEANVSFLPEDIRAAPPPCVNNPVMTDPYSSLWPGEDRLFAVGSLAGSHFVRFIVGTCVSAVSTLAHNPALGAVAPLSVAPCKTSRNILDFIGKCLSHFDIPRRWEACVYCE